VQHCQQELVWTGTHTCRRVSGEPLCVPIRRFAGVSRLPVFSLLLPPKFYISGRYAYPFSCVERNVSAFPPHAVDPLIRRIRGDSQGIALNSVSRPASHGWPPSVASSYIGHRQALHHSACYPAGTLMSGTALATLANWSVQAASAHAYAQNTWRAHRAARRVFRGWARERGLSVLSASPETVASFLKAESDAGRAVGTVRHPAAHHCGLSPSGRARRPNQRRRRAPGAARDCADACDGPGRRLALASATPT
jgi:hypothetical protein